MCCQDPCANVHPLAAGFGHAACTCSQPCRAASLCAWASRPSCSAILRPCIPSPAAAAAATGRPQNHELRSPCSWCQYPGEHYWRAAAVHVQATLSEAAQTRDAPSPTGEVLDPSVSGSVAAPSRHSHGASPVLAGGHTNEQPLQLIFPTSQTCQIQT